MQSIVIQVFLVTSLLKKLVSLFSKSHVQLDNIHFKQPQWHGWWITWFANVCSIYILKLSQSNLSVETNAYLLLTKSISSIILNAPSYFQNVNWTNVWYLMLILNHMRISITDTVQLAAHDFESDAIGIIYSKLRNFEDWIWRWPIWCIIPIYISFNSIWYVFEIMLFISLYMPLFVIYLNWNIYRHTT